MNDIIIIMHVESLNVPRKTENTLLPIRYVTETNQCVGLLMNDRNKHASLMQLAGRRRSLQRRYSQYS